MVVGEPPYPERQCIAFDRMLPPRSTTWW